MKVYLLILLVGMLSTSVAVPMVKLIAKKLGAITGVRSRDVHSVPTPRMGGLAMCFGFLVSVIFANTTAFLRPVLDSNIQIWFILLGSALISMVGILDDIFDLDWMLKLSAQILVATMVAISGVQFLSLPIGNLIVGSNLASVSFTVFVIVLFMNAVNFIDGLDGLAAGIICIGSISFFIYSYSLSMSFTSYASLVNVLTVVTIGICIGFLFYNFSEASIFMGDSGSMLLGFLVSCSSIIITGRIDPASQPIRSLPIYMPILLPILIFLFPIFDMSIAVIRRLINKKSPFAADRMHLHHRMLEIGYSKKWSVIILYTWTTFVSLSALLVAFFRLEIVIPISLVMLVVMVLVTWKAHNIWILVKSVVLHKR